MDPCNLDLASGSLRSLAPVINGALRVGELLGLVEIPATCEQFCNQTSALFFRWRRLLRRYSAQHLCNRLRQSDSIQQRVAEHQDRINDLKDLSVAVLRCALCTESMSCTQWHLSVIPPLSLDVHHLYRVQGSGDVTVACAVRVAALPCWS